MTMKIDAAEVAKVFTDLKLPAAFKAYNSLLLQSDSERREHRPHLGRLQL